MLPQSANRSLPPTTANFNHKSDLVAQDQHRRRKSPFTDSPSQLPPLGRTFKLPLYPPPSYSQAQPDAKADHGFPLNAAAAELAPIKPHAGARDHSDKPNTLPSLSSLTSPPMDMYAHDSQPTTHHPPRPNYAPPPIPEAPQPTHWPSLNPFTAYYAPGHADSAEAPLRLEPDSANSSVTSAASPMSAQDGRASSVSLDDPDVRLAAEALGDLRAGQSPYPLSAGKSVTY
jgi:transcriptional repressor OPI1